MKKCKLEKRVYPFNMQEYQNLVIAKDMQPSPPPPPSPRRGYTSCPNIVPKIFSRVTRIVHRRNEKKVTE